MTREPLVLMYHGFGTRPASHDPFNLFVPPADFDRQLRTLKRWMRPLDLDAFLRGLPTWDWPARSFLVTMDDGYESVLSQAAPILARHGVPAVAFVCPGRLGGTSGWMEEMGDERLLSADDIRRLPEFGVEVGAHGMDHALLPGLPADELHRQVEGSRAALAELTGREPRAFAYPEGRYEQAAVSAVRDAGFEAAFAVTDGGDRFSIRRRPINAQDSGVTFAVKLLPGFGSLERMSAGRPRVRRAAAWVARQRPRVG